MARFRFHKGSFKESMKTLVDVQNMEDLLVVLNHNRLDFESEILPEHIEINNYGYDGRLKEETYFVRVYNPETNTAGVVGFINENIQ